MKNSKIAWCHHTFNPWIGCQQVAPGCDNCYAEHSAPARVLRCKGVETWGPHAQRVRTSVAYWRQPLAWDRAAAKAGVRQRVFCASLADVFDPAVPLLWRQHLLSMVADTPHLDWLFLTKRIGNAARMLQDACEHDGRLMDAMDRYRPPANLWIGATICNQVEAGRDIPKLLAVPARVRFLSMEPLLGPVDLTPAFLPCPNSADGISMDPETGAHECCSKCDYTGIGDEMGIDWVIVGGESGPKARPMHPEWVRSLRVQCQSAGISFLFKQWGEWAPRSGLLTGGGEDFAEIDPGCRRWPRVIRMGEHGFDTRVGEHCTPDAGEEVYMQRVGKERAGRLLDGVLHDEYPDGGVL